ncbi:hypothetical protein SAY86_028816 [Trapa natans]|uniref:Uncharacterized protein n=1 Tax=Trapa natans TaxID=22666 RepID=A0AAN7RCJ9_TRANT|nr:hypothetical protein SAY86_028816 [Trapa natans]
MIGGSGQTGGSKRDQLDQLSSSICISQTLFDMPNLRKSNCGHSHASKRRKLYNIENIVSADSLTKLPSTRFSLMKQYEIRRFPISFFFMEKREIMWSVVDLFISSCTICLWKCLR